MRRSGVEQGIKFPSSAGALIVEISIDDDVLHFPLIS